MSTILPRAGAGLVGGAVFLSSLPRWIWASKELSIQTRHGSAESQSQLKRPLPRHFFLSVLVRFRAIGCVRYTVVCFRVSSVS